MKIDALYALADIIDACDRTHEMVVTEAIANAIDAGAGMVKVDLDGRNRTITFHNDGPPMGGREFNDYVMPGRPRRGLATGSHGWGQRCTWRRGARSSYVRRRPTAAPPRVGDVRGRQCAQWMYAEPRIRRRGMLYRVALTADYYN